jgi:hypothetical protein
VADVTNVTLKEGRFFTDGEDQRHAKVIVIGNDTAEELFGAGEDPIGKEVTVETSLYTVIGVLDKRSRPIGTGKNPNDNAILFPFNTFRDLHPEITDLMINAKYDDAKNKGLVEEEIRELLRIRRHVKTQADDNFDIFGPDSLTELWGQITGGLVAFMIAVSSVGLMVGRRWRNEHHAGERDGTNARDWHSQSDWSDQKNDSDPIHFRGSDAVRTGRRGGYSGGRDHNVDRVFPADRIAGYALDNVGDHRLWRFLRYWPAVRDLSGVEGCESGSD